MAKLKLDSIMAALQEATEAIKALEAENSLLRQSLKNTPNSTTWADFVARIAVKDARCAEILSLATVRRFDRPRIWLTFGTLSLVDSTYVGQRLKDKLRLYSATFLEMPYRISIKHDPCNWQLSAEDLEVLGHKK